MSTGSCGALAPIAAQVGPLVDQVAQPLTELPGDDLSLAKAGAFRELAAAQRARAS